jgi:hypothetical protein
MKGAQRGGKRSEIKLISAGDGNVALGVIGSE